MAGMENKQSVSTTCSVSAARETQSTTPPLGEGRSVAFPPQEPEIVQVATTQIPEPELTVQVGNRPTTGHLEEIVLYSVDDYYTVQPVTPSVSISGGDHQTTVSTSHPPIGPTNFYTFMPKTDTLNT